ncbi:MAG TPA: tetratricopeptide repeat protein [Candidatus Acidoferrum sp.]|nr:tetratricopeptide repeat protein [Candidatus Acidoferrum sp.]
MEERGELSPFEERLAVIAHASEAMQAGDLERAEKALHVALMMAKEAGPEEGRRLLPLTLYHLSLLRKKQKQEVEARHFRELASRVVDTGAAEGAPAPFAQLMANVLMSLAEYRRAIPFWDVALEQKWERNSPATMADMLWRAGECHSRTGSKDHAAVLLRAAAKFFRNQPGDPRLAAVLVTLGNALRKSVAAEAEARYREAAELHVARGQLQSATTPWMNLAILCSEQGRHEESLELYQQVLRVREQTAGTPAASVARVMNNLANCYRRMGRFAEAHAAVERAISLLKAGGDGVLAHAYGTRGLIYRDEGNDEKAMEWLRTAVTEHLKAPTPYYDSVVEDLESEIGALRRLGREKEAVEAETQLAKVRAEMESVKKSEHEMEEVESGAGAVLVEIGVGANADSAAKREVMELGHRFGALVREAGAGLYSSKVTIPESATLIFYGDDAEKMYGALEAGLRSEKICAGARVTIRQGSAVREVIVPSRVM